MGEAESTDVRVLACAVLVGCVSLAIAHLYASSVVVGAVRVRECAPVVVVVDVASFADPLVVGHAAHRRKVMD